MNFYNSTKTTLTSALKVLSTGGLTRLRRLDMIYDHVKENERQLERRTCKYGQEKQQTKGRKQFMLSEKK